MTSKENNHDTIMFFEKNNYFDYPKEYIKFFIQEDIPENTLDGKLLVNEKGKIIRGANGHGGVITSLKATNMLDDIKKKGIKWVNITPVDNPLIELIDDVFLGVAKSRNINAIGKSTVRIDPTQKNGVFCLKDNKLNVMEYTEIPKDLMEKQNEDGNLYFRYAHINYNMFSVDTIDKLLEIDIPYHIANKKCKYLDLDGKTIEPKEPNCYKYEKFIFDYYPHIDNAKIFVVDENLEYEPIKANADKAREAYLKKIDINGGNK